MSADIQPGDVVKIVRTIRVDSIGSGWLHGHDVQGGHQTRSKLCGSQAVEMVKRGVRNTPKPKALSILKGRDIKNVWWKRGTIFRISHTSDGRLVEEFSRPSAVVLAADGRLYVLDEPSESIDFEDLVDDARFELLHVA